MITGQYRWRPTLFVGALVLQVEYSYNADDVGHGEGPVFVAWRDASTQDVQDLMRKGIFK